MGKVVSLLLINLAIFGMSSTSINNDIKFKKEDPLVINNQYKYSFLEKSSLSELGVEKLTLPSGQEGDFTLNGLYYSKTTSESGETVVDITGVNTETSQNVEIVYGTPLLLDGEVKGINNTSEYYKGTNFPNAKTMIVDDNISSFDGFTQLENIIFLDTANVNLYPLFNLELPNTVKNIFFLDAPSNLLTTYNNDKRFLLSNLEKDINFVVFEDNKYTWANVFYPITLRDDYKNNLKVKVLSNEDNPLTNYTLKKEYVSGGIVYAPKKSRGYDEVYYPIGPDNYVTTCVYQECYLDKNTYLPRSTNKIYYDTLYVNQESDDEFSFQNGFSNSSGDKIIFNNVKTIKLYDISRFNNIILGKPLDGMSIDIEYKTSYIDNQKIYIPNEYKDSYSIITNAFPNNIVYFDISSNETIDLTPKVTVSYLDREKVTTDYLNASVKDLTSEIDEDIKKEEEQKKKEEEEAKKKEEEAKKVQEGQKKRLIIILVSSFVELIVMALGIMLYSIRKNKKKKKAL